MLRQSCTLLLVSGLLITCQTPAMAQLKDKLKDKAKGVIVKDDDDSPNNIEGAVWQYKVMNTKKEELKSGKFRIDGQGIYPVSNRLGKLLQDSERVGDVVKDKDKKSKEVQLRFTDFEDLKGGRAFITPDEKQQGGVWTGYYLDEKKERFRFELRRGED